MPQTLQRQVEPDHEKQKDHAEFGERVHTFDVGDQYVVQPGEFVGEAGEPVGTDGETDHQKTQYRAHVQAFNDGQNQAGGCQKDDSVV